MLKHIFCSLVLHIYIIELYLYLVTIYSKQIYGKARENIKVNLKLKELHENKVNIN